MKNKIYPLFIILAGIFWGTTGIFVRTLQSYGLSALQISCVRLITAAVIMLLFILIKDRQLLKIKLKDIWIFILSGGISVFFTCVFYFKAISLASVSVACILMYTAPIFVMITSFFVFGEKLAKRKIFAMLIAFFGCFLVSGIIGSGKAGNSPAGFLFGLGAGIAYASYSIFSKIALKKYSPYTATFYSFLVAGIAALFITDFSGLTALASKNTELLLLYPLTGLMASVVPFLLYTLGLSGMDSGSASVLSCTEPLAAALVSVFILSEPLSPVSLCGMFLILISVIMLS